MSYSKSSLIFEIEGKPLKKLFSFKNHRSYIAVYDDHLHIILKAEDQRVPINDICDIFIREPIEKYASSRTTVVHYMENGQPFKLNLLTDKTFDGLSTKMENVLQKQWSRFIEKRAYPDTIKWFIACIAVVTNSSLMNPFLYIPSIKTPESVKDQRGELRSSWGFTERSDLLSMLTSLYSGRAVVQYFRDLENLSDLKPKKQKLMERIQNTCGNNAIWAWDLQRFILLCNLGFASDYITYEESLDLALMAARKLQSIFKSWDDFMDSYLLGYCYWSNDNIEDKYSEAYARSETYKLYKGKKDSPWSVAWDYPLKQEWEPSGIISSYIYMTNDENLVTICFYSGHLIPYIIGGKMYEINEKAYMNGYNWEAFFHYYLSKHAPDIMEEMDVDSEDDVFSATYPFTAENNKRAEKFVEIVRNLIENEQELYRIVKEEGHLVKWY